MTTIRASGLLLSLLAALPVVAQSLDIWQAYELGGTYGGVEGCQGMNGTCFERPDDSCHTLGAAWDFSGDCCSLQFLDEDNNNTATGGCKLVVPTNYTCILEVRGNSESIDLNASGIVVSSASSAATSRGPEYLTSTAVCPESVVHLAPREVSSSTFLHVLSVTLNGISSLSEEQENEWKLLTENHTFAMLEGNAVLGTFDVLSSVDEMIQADDSLVEDPATQVRIFFGQYFDWRNFDQFFDSRNTSRATGPILLDIVFNSPEASAKYLAMLQSSGGFATVTSVSPVDFYGTPNGGDATESPWTMAETALNVTDPTLDGLMAVTGSPTVAGSFSSTTDGTASTTMEETIVSSMGPTASSFNATEFPTANEPASSPTPTEPVAEESSSSHKKSTGALATLFFTALLWIMQQ